MGSAAKARAARAAESASVEARRHEHSHMATHEAPATKASTWLVLKKSVRGVVTAFVASARPLGVAGVVMGLVWLALKIIDRFQLWMTAAGVLMVVMSVASAFQEVSKQSLADVEYLDEDIEQCKMISIPSTEKVIALNMTVATTTPAAVAKKTKTSPKAGNAAKPARRNSSSIELGDSQLTVVHCGTVIEIQGARGFILPHSLDVKNTKSAAVRNFGSKKPSSLCVSKLPLLIAFELTSVLTVLRHQIAVGQTVEFCFPGDETSNETVLAVNVKPVAAEQEILKSRHALLTCKQAREVSFARAMDELTMISPRNEPIAHHVDLIKYAEFLDDDDGGNAELPMEQFI